MKKSILVITVSGNRLVILSNKSVEISNRSVIRIGIDSEDSEDGGGRNVVI